MTAVDAAVHPGRGWLFCRGPWRRSRGAATFVSGCDGRMTAIAERGGRDAITGGRRGKVGGGGGKEVRQMLPRCTLGVQRLWRRQLQRRSRGAQAVYGQRLWQGGHAAARAPGGWGGRSAERKMGPADAMFR